MAINHDNSTIIPLLREYFLEQDKHSTKVRRVVDKCRHLFHEESTLEQRATLMQVVEDYVKFIMSDSGKFIINYREHAKMSALKDLNLFLSEEDSRIHAFISRELEQLINDAIQCVNATPFVRDVRPAGWKPMKNGLLGSNTV